MSVACKVCGGNMKQGVVIVPGLYGSDDFGGDFGDSGTTMSEGPSDGKLTNCLKCEKCGHSFIPSRTVSLLNLMIEAVQNERAEEFIELYCKLGEAINEKIEEVMGQCSHKENSD